MRYLKFVFSFVLLFCCSFAYSRITEATEYNKYIHEQMTEQFVFSDGQLYKLTFHYDTNGNLIRKNKDKVKSNIYYPSETSYSNGSYNIVVAGIDTAVKQVSFPTWTEKNGQDDLIWYSGERIGNGMWKVTIPFSRHNYEQGKYITHIYADKSIYAFTETMVKATTKLQIPVERNLAKGSYEVVIEGVGPEVTAVQFPTWTDANGQDDLIWHEGYKISEGTWKAIIPFKEHNQERGTYITHVYSYDKYGNIMNIEGGTTTAVPGAYALPEVSYSDASYEVMVAGVDASVKRVIFPTWTQEKEQDDIIWYEGEQVDKGIWRAVIPFAKHSGERGSYITHIYDATHNVILGMTNTNVKDTITVRIAPQVNLADGSYDIFIDGVGEHVSSVKFYTWTQQNGQDDLEWREGYKQSDGTWMANIDFSQHHQEMGPYITHIYSNDQYGNNVLVGITNTTAIRGIKAPTKISLYSDFFDVIAYGINPAATKVQFPTWTNANGQDDLTWYDGEKIDHGVWKVRVYYDKHNKESGLYVTHIYADGVLWGNSTTNVEK